MQTIWYREMDSPIGPLLLVSTGRDLCRVDFGSYEDNRDELCAWSKRWLNTEKFAVDEQLFGEAELQFTQYFNGERSTFDLELEWFGTPFQQKVWQALLDIPYGKAWSYRDVAGHIGSPRAVRAVGGANNRNPLPIIVPCHRVIGANGHLVGYGGGLHIKQHLLQLEGYEISEG